MSIYATLWEMRFPVDGWMGFTEEDFAKVYAQAVPPHIGHPRLYPDGDPYGAFLPPPVGLDQETEPAGPPDRAVIICGPRTTKGNARSHQEYVDPLLVLTGREYMEMPWHELWQQIGEALRQQLGVKPTVMLSFTPALGWKRITSDQLGELEREQGEEEPHLDR